MHSELRAQAAFRLTGLGAGAGVTGRLRPALAARMHDLCALRYDFPVVLLSKPVDDEVAAPLVAIVDRLLEAVAPPDGESARFREHVLHLEREIRTAVAGGASGSLGQLWDAAAARLADRGSPAMARSLAIARKALGVDGDVADCDARFPRRHVLHAWRLVEARKAAMFRDEIEGLTFRLRQILAADAARSAQGRGAARLTETFAHGDRDSIDFDVLARLLARSAGKPPLSEARRHRVASLIAELESGRLFTGEDPEVYSFERCGPALRAFRSRYQALRTFVGSLAMARLEVEGAYDDTLHAPLFRQLAQSPLLPDDLERLPTYLVCLRREDLDAAERADLEEMLCSGIPARILVQTDDLLAEAGAGDSLGAFGAHAHALAGSAIGLDDVFVLQAPSSILPRMQEAILRGLRWRGTTLFSVFSGACGASACLPPYLNAAAALESRVFPAFVHDPAAGGEDRVALSLAHNPQWEREWPLHDLDYEDAGLQRVRRQVTFTPADFAAADARFARHFLPVDVAAADGEADALTVLAVDERDHLRELLVDEAVAIQSRRCGNRWRQLQRLASRGVPVNESDAAESAVAADEAAPVAPVSSPPEAPPAPVPASGDEAYIETARCSTCNECIQINDRMFAYDANRQARIADVTAGTYRELVEAAEGCQVSVIHPGKPRNPDEPGLDELIERAQPFR